MEGDSFLKILAYFIKSFPLCYNRQINALSDVIFFTVINPSLDDFFILVILLDAAFYHQCLEPCLLKMLIESQGFGHAPIRHDYE